MSTKSAGGMAFRKWDSKWVFARIEFYLFQNPCPLKITDRVSKFYSNFKIILTFVFMEGIKNKVKESGLIQLDLADFKPKETIVGIDLSNQLWQGLVLKEKDFREWIKTENWEQYAGKAVFIFCSADAIVPTWAYMLVASSLNGIASVAVVGSKSDLDKQLIQRNIEALNVNEFINGKVIIKGCSDISAPEFAMVTLLNHIQPVVSSIMYGEPCSTVPVFKRRKVN
ncbi:MAG: DUF2480 family protein [Bacteroidota bacterium]